MNKKFDDWLDQQLGLKTATPTYLAADVTEIGEAEQKFDQAFENFLVKMEAWNEENDPEGDDPFADFAEEHTETGKSAAPASACSTLHDRRR